MVIATLGDIMPNEITHNKIDRRALLALAGAAAAGSWFPANAVKAQGASPAPKPADWAKSEAISLVRLSPDGKHICYMTEKDAIKFLYVFDLATDQVKSYNMGNSDVASINWVDDSHVLVTALMAARYTTGGDGWKGQRRVATVFNLADTTQNVLYSNMPEFNIFVGHVPVRINYEGKLQLIALSTKKDESDDYSYLYRFDLDGTKSWVMDQATNGLDWIVTPEGEMVARTSYDYRHRGWTVDYRKNGAWKQIYRYEVERLFPDVICLAADGKSLIISVPSDGEINDICLLSPEGELSAPLVEHGSNRYPTIDKLTYRHNGFTRYDGWVHYEYGDPALAAVAVKAQKAVGDYRMVISATGDNPNQTIIYTEGDDDAGTYYYIDFATKKPLEIGRSYPDIPTEWIATKQAITYKAADGLDIPAYLTLPPGKAPKGLPLIVYPHNGPASNNGMEFEWVVQALASRGYAVLQPNFRGSTRFGEAFIKAGSGEWGKKMQTDLSDGVAFLTSQGTVDARRVCILGSGSYSGYAALAGVSLQSGIYNCAVAAAPITDMQLYRVTYIDNETSPSYRYFRRLVGQDTDLNAISPAKNANKIDVPVMLIHSEEETSVDIKQSRVMAGAMKSSGKSVEFIEFKAEDNWGLVEKSRVAFINYVTTFIEKHNPPV
jgi:dipeptidyl aminopeptidase/acylaminoacyl peptidase